MALSRVLAASALLWTVAALSALAQEAVLTNTPAAGQAPPAPAWATRCVSDGRQAQVQCSLEQRLLMQGSGQLVGAVTIQMQPGGGATLLATTPLGLYIPGGVTVDVDGNVTQKLDLQTCDRDGCYASGVLSDGILSAMLKGKKFDVVFQSLAKQTVTLPLSLVGFGAALQKVK